MKRALKELMVISCAAVVLLGCIVLYITHYKVVVVDAVPSADGVYQITLQSIGEPEFPFGVAHGRLVLRNNKKVISKTDITIANDGGPIFAENWSVTWFDRYVEIILSGDEQYDERVTLYYDGQVERSQLTTH